MRKPLAKHSLIVAAIVTVATVGCGDKSTTSPREASPRGPAPKVGVKITSPERHASVNARVQVRGVVTPAEATVDVNGEEASVHNGRFTAMVVLKKGDQRLHATAAANGVTDEVVVPVSRRPTAAETRAVARRKAAEARRRRAADKAGSGSSASDGSFTMPNEVGMDLQEAQDDIQRVSGDPIFISHSRDATGQGRFQILDRDWKVCGQNIPAGQTVSAVGHVVFSVVKDDEDCP